MTALARTVRAEWLRLARPRVWLGGGAVAVGYAVLTVLVAVAAAAGEPEGVVGRTRAALEAAGGGTGAVVAAAGFSSVLVLSAFVAATAADVARGTWRSALLHEPDPVRLAAGKYLATLGVVGGLVTGALLVGWATAALVAPATGVDVQAWASAAGLRAAGAHLLGVLALAAVWGLVGTLLGVLTRSVPVALGAAICWAGPMENILGDELPAAQDWFPGLLLQAVLDGDADLRTATTLVAYAAGCAALVVVVLRRRDTTA